MLDYGLRVRILDSSIPLTEKLCTFCPFHPEFTPYFERIGLSPIFEKYDIKCKNTKMCFHTHQGLKQHYHSNQHEFWHKLLYILLKQMYEDTPTPYGPTTAIRNVFDREQTNKKYNLRRNYVRR